MARPPRLRSTGFSRRAQMGAFLSGVLGLVAVVAGFLLLLLSRVAPGAYMGVRGVLLDISAPVTSVLRMPVTSTVRMVRSINDHFDTVGRNHALEMQNARLRKALDDAQIRLRHSASLEALAHAAGPGRVIVVRARLVGASPTGFVRSAVISAGTSDGVRVGQPVLAAEGLIGRIIETGGSASRVLLLTDGDSRVPVRLARSGAPALAIGHEDGLVELHAIEGDRNPFRPGDLITTSGLGGIYPPDVPVARVLSISGDGALARPLSSPARAEFVMVEQPWFPPAGVIALPPPVLKSR